MKAISNQEECLGGENQDPHLYAKLHPGQHSRKKYTSVVLVVGLGKWDMNCYNTSLWIIIFIKNLNFSRPHQTKETSRWPQ